ncbi:hypothetical protein EWF20_09920 [Sulfolobus sp. S-194]|uniref:hypothetical protein n=1 Tax=Sulfolobus sp. S-194 TaxID=2512240 RepID=UPI001436FFC7|nr:hypothetical protein [Sulfolobus sp. S-194]QIW24437.1 hypothetical protein EWF20_09920 [Sulfolobus sp. S-194]
MNINKIVALITHLNNFGYIDEIDDLDLLNALNSLKLIETRDKIYVNKNFYKYEFLVLESNIKVRIMRGYYSRSEKYTFLITKNGIKELNFIYDVTPITKFRLIKLRRSNEQNIDAKIEKNNDIVKFKLIFSHPTTFGELIEFAYYIYSKKYIHNNVEYFYILSPTFSSSLHITTSSRIKSVKGIRLVRGPFSDHFKPLDIENYSIEKKSENEIVFNAKNVNYGIYGVVLEYEEKRTT